MFISETKIRVRYGETDKMGYVYYGNYPLYYEVARAEMLRTLNWSYRKMEEEGVILPVASLNIKYIKPAFYDDELTVRTTLKEFPGVKICFYHEVFNEKNELINIGEVTLVFVNFETMRPMSSPAKLNDELKKFFD